MPIYEYACKNCNHTLDALQKMSEEPLVYCPSCGQAGLKRLISAPRFRLKGDGWYETDFKQDNQRNILKKDAEPPKDDKKDDSPSGDKAGKPAKSENSSDKSPGGKVDSA
ncbi:MAG: FmdB family zinc ribbon protein [Woeseia sp.]